MPTPRCVATVALLALLLVLLPPVADAARAVDEDAAARQFRFAKGLFDREMYAECLDETTRFLDFYRESRLIEKGLYLHAETLYRLDRTKEAADAFERFLSSHAGSPLAREARYTLAWARLTLRQEAEALAQFRALFDAPDRTMRADARLRAATILARTGDHAAAEKLLADLARDKATPPETLPETLAALARAQRALGRAGDAEKTLRRLLKDFPAAPERPQALASLAELLVAARKPKDALPLFREALALAPAGAAAARLRHAVGWCRFDLGEFPAAAEEFAKVVAELEAAAKSGGAADKDLLEEARLARGKSLFHAKRYAEAAEALARVQGPDARFHEGFSHLKSKAYEPALAALAKVPADAGETGRLALFYRGVALFETKRHSEAAALFARYLEAGGGDKADLARLNIAQCRMASNDRAGAMEEFRTLSDRAGDDATREQARFALAELLAADGRTDEAVAALDALPEKSGRRDEALLRAGDLLRAAGRGSDALARYRRAGRTSPAGRTAALRAGRILAEAGDAAAAEAALLDAAKGKDGDPVVREARYELARLASARGDLAALTAHAEPLLSGGVPFRLETLNLLAAAELAAGDRAGATARLERVIAEGKDGPAAVEARLLLAEACAADGRHDDGIVHAERALALARGNEEQGRAQFLLGRLLEGKGEQERAIREYLKIEILYRDTTVRVPAALALAGLHLARGRKADAAKLLSPLLPELRGEQADRAKALLDRAK